MTPSIKLYSAAVFGVFIVLLAAGVIYNESSQFSYSRISETTPSLKQATYLIKSSGHSNFISVIQNVLTRRPLALVAVLTLSIVVLAIVIAVAFILIFGDNIMITENTNLNPHTSITEDVVEVDSLEEESISWWKYLLFAIFAVIIFIILLWKFAGNAVKSKMTIQKIIDQNRSRYEQVIPTLIYSQTETEENKICTNIFMYDIDSPDFQAHEFTVFTPTPLNPVSVSAIVYKEFKMTNFGIDSIYRCDSADIYYVRMIPSWINDVLKAEDLLGLLHRSLNLTKAFSVTKESLDLLTESFHLLQRMVAAKRANLKGCTTGPTNVHENTIFVNHNKCYYTKYIVCWKLKFLAGWSKNIKAPCIECIDDINVVDVLSDARYAKMIPEITKSYAEKLR